MKHRIIAAHHGTCPECGSTFKAKYWSKDTCSGRCRVRKMRRIKRAAKRAQAKARLSKAAARLK